MIKLADSRQFEICECLAFSDIKRERGRKIPRQDTLYMIFYFQNSIDYYPILSEFLNCPKLIFIANNSTIFKHKLSSNQTIRTFVKILS